MNTPKKVIKIGRRLWNEILFADESDGFGICTSCEKIESGWFQLYQEGYGEIACPNCMAGILEPTGDLIICGELECEDSDYVTPSVKIREFLEGLFCDLDYEAAYEYHAIEIQRLLKDDDFEIHHPALKLMLEIVHSYDEHLN